MDELSADAGRRRHIPPDGRTIVERALTDVCEALELEKAEFAQLDGDGERNGILEVLARPGARPLSERELAMLEVLASTLGEAVERARSDRSRQQTLEAAVIERTAAQRLGEATLSSYEAELVHRLAMAVEYRDDETGAHVERVSRTAGDLACRAGLSTGRCEQVRHAAPLHDVGKMAIPDSILLKPGRLDAEERAIVETHAATGWQLLRGSVAPVLRVAATIALTHHERYNGGGYPRGLAGDEIAVEGRIVAIADVFDALSHDRVYRPAMPPERVVELMVAERGKHFDPDLLDLFLADVATG